MPMRWKRSLSCILRLSSSLPLYRVVGQDTVAHVAQVGFLGINPSRLPHITTAWRLPSTPCLGVSVEQDCAGVCADQSCITVQKRVRPELVRTMPPAHWVTQWAKACEELGMPHVSSVSHQHIRRKRRTRAHLTGPRPRQDGNVGDCWSGNSGKSNSVVNRDKLVAVAYAAVDVRAFYD